jgi:hypothetical protein
LGGYSWIFVDIRGYPGIFVDNVSRSWGSSSCGLQKKYGNFRIFGDIRIFFFHAIIIRGYSWILVDIRGYSWIFVDKVSRLSTSWEAFTCSSVHKFNGEAG